MDVDVPDAVAVAEPLPDAVADTLGCELYDEDGDALDDELGNAVNVGSDGIAEALADVLFVADDEGNALDEADGDVLSELLGFGVDVGAADIEAHEDELGDKVGNDVTLGDELVVARGDTLAEPEADPDDDGLVVALSEADDENVANELLDAETEGVPELVDIED